MKTRIMLLAIVYGLLSANNDPATKTGDLAATVVRVESRETPSHSIYAGGSPSDLALQSEIYSHDIGMGVGSTTYRTSGDSCWDCLTALFAANQAIQVNRTKHVIHATPSLDRPMRTAIESPSGV
jgi:hypothetical protein